MANFDIAFKYYIKAKKLYDSVKYFDFGGGTPLPIDGEFDYEAYTKGIQNGGYSGCPPCNRSKRVGAEQFFHYQQHQRHNHHVHHKKN